MTTYKAHLDCGCPLIIVIAVLLDKLGGEADITQADIDKVAYGRVLEGQNLETGALALKNESLTAPVHQVGTAGPETAKCQRCGRYEVKGARPCPIGDPRCPVAARPSVPQCLTPDFAQLPCVVEHCNHAGRCFRFHNDTVAAAPSP